MSDQQEIQIHTYFAQDMDAPQSVPTYGGKACVFSARCPTKTTSNEDAAAVIPFGEHSVVLVVADGLGGSAAGELASRLAVQSIREAMEEAQGAGMMLRSGIITGFERANEAVQQLGIGAATTCAAMEIADGTARPYHVGDSMILIVGGRGKVKLQTVAHSPVGYAVEAGLIDEDEALHHEHRHLVSNVVGSSDMHIEIGPPVKLARRDTVLLASDGLCDNLYGDRIAETVRKGSLLKAASQLARESRQRMTTPDDAHPSKPDDLTFIVFRQT